LPICLRSERDISAVIFVKELFEYLKKIRKKKNNWKVHFSRIVTAIGFSKREFTSRRAVGVAAEPETEHGRVNEVLFDEVVKNWSDVIDRNRNESESQNTIELGQLHKKQEVREKKKQKKLKSLR
jgi:hypothetical protein